jgi:predicted AlkP superfamily pyrophosphatase or phosphodiesterase
VSLDGWRWDYLDRAKTPRLNALAASGVRSEGLIPSFPSKTFPNHYTIVTGLYPEHHGVVSNNMLDATIGERFSMSAPTAKDSRWWGGEPIWATAQKQGLITASMFWPGSEVEIGGVRPTHWKPFDDKFPNRQRVQQVLDWLALPEKARPSFITLYFSDVDNAGHTFGPESTEVLEAAATLDAEIGALVDGVNAIEAVAGRVHYVIVSDHGMSKNSPERVVVLDDYLDMRTVDLIDTSPVAGFWPKTGTAEDIYLALKDKHPSMAVYRRAEVPASLHYSQHPRIPPVIAVAADGWSLGSKTQADQWQSGERRLGGNHGYDPSLRSMHGLFIANGAQFRKGTTIPPLANIHLYAMMARVLGLIPVATDGRAEATAAVFAAK